MLVDFAIPVTSSAVSSDILNWKCSSDPLLAPISKTTSLKKILQPM